MSDEQTNQMTGFTRLMGPSAEIERLRDALTEIDRLSPRPGGVGQIARDALRLCK